MDWVIGLWMLWISLLFYFAITAKSILLKTLTVLVMALSVHDAWQYIKIKINSNDLKEMEDEDKQVVEIIEKENAKKDP